MQHLIIITVLVLAATAIADSGQIAVIPIMSRPAASLVDTVRPLLGRDGSVSAFHDKLIVKGSAQQIAAVRSLLRDIDRPARRLIIEVRQAGSLSQAARSFGYGVSNENVRLGRAPPGSGARLHYQDIQTRGRDDSTQRVQALDGRPALIRAGQSVPVYHSYQGVRGNRFVQGYELNYRDATSGFFALPRVHGDQVTIEIYQQHQRAVENDRFDMQQASTVLNGNLGQWMVLGSVGNADSDDSDQLGRHVQTHRATDRRLELRVLAVD